MKVASKGTGWKFCPKFFILENLIENIFEIQFFQYDELLKIFGTLLQ